MRMMDNPTRLKTKAAKRMDGHAFGFPRGLFFLRERMQNGATYGEE
jgi:hypothetical protein